MNEKQQVLLPNVDFAQLKPVDSKALLSSGDDKHSPKILVLYGSLRDPSYSRLVSEECAYLLDFLGAQTKTFNPVDLPLKDSVDASHPKVQELRDLAKWSEGMVWVSPELHGSMSGIFKTQLDWIPLSEGAVRPTQGKTLAVVQVNGGSQSFNVVNQLRVLGRWMRMITIPNQSSIPKTFSEFENGRMKPSPFYNRLVDVMEELVKFTYLTRGHQSNLVDRYSEKMESSQALIERVSSTPSK